ncbi:MAG TPA: alpha/beta hydrolase [Candidatus Binataceae bacterium]|jgi:pimeloyl-ACP methyl ester carboxylesterase|nr:alpha/beta hydrolase [Candidatus Binataceae bacterium]
MATDFKQEKVHVAGTDLTFVKGGSGRPLLVLHEELGHPGWLRWHSELARNRELLIPIQPGFAGTQRVDWIANMRDLAGFYGRVAREMKLTPVDVIGFSTGGWVAAEMAAQNFQQFGRMVLVAPAGVRPPSGEIMDIFTVTARAYLASTVLDRDTPELAKLYGGERTPEQFEAFEDARSEIARLAWEPYLFSPSLPHLLEGVTGLPTLIIWGRQDPVVPASAGEAYSKVIAGSRLALLDRCGHRPEIEKTDDFVKLVRDFLG